MTRSPSEKPNRSINFRLPIMFWLTALVASSVAAFGFSGLSFAFLVASAWSWYWAGKNGTEVLVGLAILAVVVTLMVPAVGLPRVHVRRMQCINNQKQIMLALLNYESDNGHFPPPYLADENGTPVHSWRVLILPYMDCEALYKRYDFDEPWDGPNNSKLLSEMPRAFKCPSHTDGLCRYRAVVGEGSAWRARDPVRLGEIVVGTSRCIMLCETIRGVPWTKPHDTTPAEFLNESTQLAMNFTVGGHLRQTDFSIRGRCANLGFADGHIETIMIPEDLHQLNGRFRIDGKYESARAENVAAASSEGVVASLPQPRSKWGAIISACSLVIVSVLPFFARSKQSAQ